MRVNFPAIILRKLARTFISKQRSLWGDLVELDLTSSRGLPATSASARWKYFVPSTP